MVVALLLELGVADGQGQRCGEVEEGAILSAGDSIAHKHEKRGE